MTGPWDPPLPPIPSGPSEEEMAAFVADSRAQDVVDLLAGLSKSGGDLGNEDMSILRGASQVATENPDHVVCLLELLAAHADPDIRYYAPSILPSLLGRGIERVEQIAWDELLRDPDDRVFYCTYQWLDELVRCDSPGVILTWAGVSYDQIYVVHRWREHVTALLKLGRVSSRAEGIRADWDAESSQ